MKRSLLNYAITTAVGAGLWAGSWGYSSDNRPETAHFRPTSGRSRRAKLSPAERLMRKAQARRKKGGAA